ncbi:Uncharacterised protein [Mycobacteroides abscessus subsp. abscessus]|nr:Uncharacterised protein [Mycobacteroides abscessus subsp. abscessus]
MNRRLPPPRGSRPVNTEPTAKRSSGSSVRTSTDNSPVTPCALAIRPTTSSMELPVGVHHVDPAVAVRPPRPITFPRSSGWT